MPINWLRRFRERLLEKYVPRFDLDADIRRVGNLLPVSSTWFQLACRFIRYLRHPFTHIDMRRQGEGEEDHGQQVARAMLR